MPEVRARAAVLATIGALGIAACAYFDWLDDRVPYDIPLDRLLLTSVSGDAPSYWQSMAAPLAVVGAIGVLGALLLSRLVLLLSFLLGLATLALFVTMETIDRSPEESLAVADFQPGAWIALGSLLLVLIGLATLKRPVDETEDDDDEIVDRLPYTPARSTTSYDDNDAI